MPNHLLRRLRFWFSLLIVVLLTLPFIDFTGIIPPEYIRAINWTQFIPSILKFFEIPNLLGTGFLLVIILSLLFGRVYCSWLCPFGWLQDLFSRIGRLTSKKRRFYKYLPPLNYLRYGLLILVGALAFFRINTGLIFTDPFSIYGRIANHLLMPLVLGINNLVSNLLGNSGFYGLKPYPYQGFDIFAVAIGVFYLIIIAYISFTKGRLYCTAWCPVGTLLGLFSRFSLFKIYLDESRCNQCGLCATSCKAGCIDSKNTNVEFDRCVGCFNCLTVCRDNGVKYGIPPKKTKSNPSSIPDTRRREILLSILAIGIVQKVFGKDPIKVQKAFIEAVSESAVSPPGAINNERFTSVCTACHACLSACPTRVLQPAFLQHGIKGMLQPFMDYHNNFCNYECTKCMEVCPTGALIFLTPENKKRTQLGKAKFIEKNCVVYTDETACGACSEHCPSKAVDMVFYKPGLTIPEVTEDICVGCGACEYACPTLPYKAIYVEANAIHQVAKEPKGSDKSKEEVPEEFPF
jgi:ferredoxin-type protein NapF